MPNNVMNILKMQGITKLPLFSHKDGQMEFDLSKIVPMPEALNRGSGSIEDLAIETVLRKLVSHPRSLLCSYITTGMKDDAYQRSIENSAISEDELCKLGLAYISNKALYGATSWYDWCIMNWNTKWNAYSTDMYDDDTIAFATACSPPENVIARLAEMYPGAVIEHWWADEDCGNNSGYTMYGSSGGTIKDYHESGSSAADETFVHCWGENSCLYQDDEGLWHHKNCDECQEC